MGNDIFNFVLSDINGIPALPVFIGNYLLDLLSTFFPLFVILSSFIMVYTGLTRGSGDWKQTAQQIAPSAVAIVVILALLSMKTEYRTTDGQTLKGDFWEGTSSYTVVEMMSTFLSFGNLFADALTHKILYGTIEVSDNDSPDFNGYFPAVMQALLDSQKDSQVIKMLQDLDIEKEILEEIDSRNKIASKSIAKVSKDIQNLGIAKDHKNINRNNFMDASLDDPFTHKALQLDSRVLGNEIHRSAMVGNGIMPYGFGWSGTIGGLIGGTGSGTYKMLSEPKEFETNKLFLQAYTVKDVGVNSTDDSTTNDDSKGSKEVSDDTLYTYAMRTWNKQDDIEIDIQDFYEASTSDDSAHEFNLDVALSKNKKEKNSAPNASIKGTFHYLEKNNFQEEEKIVNVLIGMADSDIKMIGIYDAYIKKLEQEKLKASKKDKVKIDQNLKIALSEKEIVVGKLKNILNIYGKFWALAGRVAPGSMLNKHGQGSNNVGLKGYIDSSTKKITKAIGKGEGIDVISKIAIKNDPIGAKVIEGLATTYISPIKLDDVPWYKFRDKDVDNATLAKNAKAISDALNKRMKNKSNITNFFYAEMVSYLKDDLVSLGAMGKDVHSAYARNFFSKDQFKGMGTLYELDEEIDKNYRNSDGKYDVNAHIKKEIATKHSGLDGIGLIHWTDLGKYYGNFKNVFSPVLDNIFYLSKKQSSDKIKMVKLVTFMHELSPTAKSERILQVVAVYAGAKITTGILKGGIGIATSGLTGGASGFSDLWDVIKTVGGVYFALLFVNVILPAFVWMFVIITYYVEMALYIAVFPIGFMFMIFQSYRQSLHQYINMLLGFILMPVILVSMFFVVLYIDMLLPLFFKQFMPYFSDSTEIGKAMQTGLGGGGTNSAMNDIMGVIIDKAGSISNYASGLAGGDENTLMSFIGNMIYTILSMLMSVLLLMTFFRANEYMSKILNVSTVGMDSFQGRETLNKFGSFDKSGLTAGVVGR